MLLAKLLQHIFALYCYWSRIPVLLNVSVVFFLYGFDLQKYEMIKTEDIPHLENSTFSTRVVKDIAQNILSFLKSNCTKEGHTYWLFKGNR